MKYIVTILFIILKIHMPLFSQHENKNWYFGMGTDGIIFDINNNPVKVNNKYSSGTFGFEGIIVVNNPVTGDLLFYSDGVKVINKNHTIMTNGTGLSGNYSGAQCVQCCPVPGTCAKKYYLFTNSSMDQTAGVISYSIVDFTNNPLGIVTNNNTPLWAGPSSEGMCLVNKPNSNDYWLIINQGSSATYKVFPLTSSGIGPLQSFTFINTGSSYQMNYNKTVQKLIVTGYGNKHVTLIDFNANTGILTNEVQLAPAFTAPVGAARFSANGSKLYVSYNGNVWQYNYSTGGVWTNMNTGGYPHDLLLGPDGKMYHIYNYNVSQPIAVIDFPDNTAIGNACNYHLFSFPSVFNGEVRRFPEFVTLPPPPTANIDYYTINSSLPATFNVMVNDSDAQGDPIVLDSIIHLPLHGTAVINNGQIIYTPDTSSVCGLKDTLIYSIKDINCAYDTAIVIINGPISLLVALGNDTTICQGNNLVLNANNSGCTYLWNTGQTSQTINITSSGFYTVKVTNNIGCIGSDTIFINFNSNLALNLGNDTSICLGNSLQLNANNTGCAFLWNTGQITQSINVTASGNYSVKVTNISGCYARDTINVNIITSLVVNIGKDTTICQGNLIVLNAANAGSTYQWNTGENSMSISIQNQGIYWVKVNNNNCFGSDTVNVSVVLKPVISLGNDTIMCSGDLIILTPGLSFLQYLWSDGSTLSKLNVTKPGIYSVFVFDGWCSASDGVFIDECGSEIWVPNVFTPNEDGINDFFSPVYTNIDKITLYIYNRWGNQLYEGSGMSANWDGKYLGDLCSEGVYYYLIEYENKGTVKSIRQHHGSITLLN